MMEKLAKFSLLVFFSAEEEIKDKKKTLFTHNFLLLLLFGMNIYGCKFIWSFL